MKAKEIRQHFLRFFEEKGHQIVPSAPMVLKDDPTLMFTNAGMNQFKDIFLGNAAPEHRRIANTQKCLRVSGKHNDLEEVGLDTYHHTMFEMLGNWSFGDYFKARAIEWAWELLTKIYKLPPDRLYATVFEGDDEDKLPPDSEAADLWKKYLPAERILYAAKKDNFWEMGETGPCGPCSEIHIDLRPERERAKQAGQTLVNADHPQVVEIWNLVFIQFNRMSDRSLKKLPETHVDTGMGFERLVMAIQAKASNYDTDVFAPLLNHLAQKTGIAYGKTEKTAVAMRVIADHLRAIAFAIADGQLPSNNKAGYVIRRILRRAVRYGYNFLDLNAPFMHEMVPILAEQFAEVFPEIKSEAAFIGRVIAQEEAAFLNTLEKGLQILEDIIDKQKDNKRIDGKIAFTLNDTYGFPFDLTTLIAREHGFETDEKGFEREMAAQKERSRKAASSAQSDWIDVSKSAHQTEKDTEFVGYDCLKTAVKILRYRVLEEKEKKMYQIVLDRTPFYAESGGQVGDTGQLKNDAETLDVVDTRKENNLIVHLTKKLPKNPEADFEASVNGQKRLHTSNNHSATHLLHAALRTVLGNHVVQKGSLVNEKILRFDFAHFSKMTDEEISTVEQIVNEKIRANIGLEVQENVPIERAKAMGATALFGEKYGNFVRVVTFDKAYSIELCGGTHVSRTGQIGLFKILSEGAIAAGVRRIEAVTASAAENFVNTQLNLLNTLKQMLKNPHAPQKSLETLVAEKTALQKEVKRLRNKEIEALKNNLLGQVNAKNGMNILIAQVSLPGADELKPLCFAMREKVENLFMVLAAEVGGKPQIAVMISDNLVADKKLHAGKLVKILAKEIKGGGGGQAFFATAGGKDLGGLDKVVEKALTAI